MTSAPASSSAPRRTAAGAGRPTPSSADRWTNSAPGSRAWAWAPAIAWPSSRTIASSGRSRPTRPTVVARRSCRCTSRSSPDEWVFILRDCGAKMVIASTQAIFDTLQKRKIEMPSLEHVIGLDLPASDERSFAAVQARGKGKSAPPEQPSAKEIAGFIYTSGTTGKPKGVVLTHKNFVSNVNAINQVFPMDPSDRSLAFLPWAHAFGQTAELHALLSQGAFDRHQRRGPEPRAEPLRGAAHGTHRRPAHFQSHLRRHQQADGGQAGGHPLAVSCRRCRRDATLARRIRGLRSLRSRSGTRRRAHLQEGAGQDRRPAALRGQRQRGAQQGRGRVRRTRSASTSTRATASRKPRPSSPRTIPGTESSAASASRSRACASSSTRT